MTHAVEQRQDRRPGADRGRKGVHRALEVVCLAAQQDEIEGFVQCFRGHHRRGDEIDVTEPAHDRKSARKLCGAPRPHQERHVVAGFEQPRAEIAADRAGADNENPHTILQRHGLVSAGRGGSSPQNGVYAPIDICGYTRICTFVKEEDSAMSLETRSTAQDCICLTVRQAARHVTQFYDRLLAPSGLRTTQFSLLAKLRRQGSMTINALAADMVMDRTTLGRNILPLERDGLIRIEPAASDRRSKELHLTRRGEKRLEAALKGWAEAQARFESTFGSTRASDLRGLLRAVTSTEF